MNAIEIKGLCKYYGNTMGIEDVDLSVSQGDFFGFIGPNGAGKSTTIRTLLGYIKKTSGEASICGLDIEKDHEKILSLTGYLPSEAIFKKGMRVSDILKLSADLRGIDCKKEADSLCQRLALDPSKKVDELSFGNRKKVGIVCAMQHCPSLYILDEPTSGLDPLIQREFYALLTERNHDGATVFLSSHVLSEVGRYCKGAAVIRSGRILASDRVCRLGHTGVKRITLRSCPALPSLSGIRDIKTEGDTTAFLYSGDTKELLSALSLASFEDITIADPDLEEVFLHYYEKEA